MKNIVQSNFHITIAATVTGEQDVVQQVEHVLNATKVALLYADNVTLYSTAVNFINPLLTITHLNQKQKINLLELILPTMCVAQPEKASSYKSIISELKLLNKHNLQGSEIERRKIVQSTFEVSWKEIQQKLVEFRHQNKITEFETVVSKGVLDLRPLGSPLNEVEQLASWLIDEPVMSPSGSLIEPADDKKRIHSMVHDFSQIMQQMLNSKNSYPLFDQMTGDFVNNGLKAGWFSVSELQVSRAKHSKLASEMIRRLPSFESATIEELLDIKTELGSPLIRFRRAMMEYSKTMSTVAWGSDFEIEAEEIYLEKFQTALLEIDEAVRSNKYLMKLVSKLFASPL